MQPSQLQNFLECEKTKDKHKKDIDYERRYVDHYQDSNYYERFSSYDEG